MKKMILAIMLFVASMTGKVSADPLGDAIKLTLLDRVSAVSQFGSGEVRGALVDSVVLIGSYDGKSILHLQGGFNRDVEESDINHFIYGAQLRVDPFVNAKLHLPEDWEFLRTLEHGPAVHYDTDRHSWYGYYQVGLAFGLNPQP